jgi:HAMP domain-containing protein
MNIDPILLVSQLSGLFGALIGGGASLAVAVYTHRSQDRLQRVAHEITKRETIYAEFLMEASKLLLRAYTRDEIVEGSDEQQLIGLINRMRLFAPTDVVGGAEAVVKAIIEISLKPGIEFRQLAVQALSKSPEPDPFLTFSLVCRSDLDSVRRTMR